MAMAVFGQDARSQARLDYRLLQWGGISLYFSSDVLAEDLRWLRAEGYVVHEFDCHKWKTDEDFHTDVSRELDFPSYYGRNLDAFNDCMRDVEVPQNGGMAIVFRGVDAPGPREGKMLPIVLHILAGAIRDRLLVGRRLLVLLQSRNPAIEFEPVGAVPVAWNPREWLNSRRGL